MQGWAVGSKESALGERPMLRLGKPVAAMVLHIASPLRSDFGGQLLKSADI
jgi:hypothetical protein